MAVKAVKAIIDPANDHNVNLNMIKVVKKLGETVEESQVFLNKSC
jgi:chaperonin GroEL (HSP60 family)